MYINQIIMKAKLNGILLFNGIEKGIGNTQKGYTYISSQMSIEK